MTKSQYTQAQQYVRLKFFRSLLYRWLSTADLPRQFVSKPDTAFLAHSMGSVLMWRCLEDTSKGLVVGREFFEIFLKKMQRDLNFLVPVILQNWFDQIEKLQADFLDIQSRKLMVETGKYSNNAAESKYMYLRLQWAQNCNEKKQAELRPMLTVPRILISDISYKGECLFLDFLC